MTHRLHGTLWRWHFFAGLAACPILFVVALTGALYSFQPELQAWLDEDLLVVEPSGSRRPLDDLVRSVPSTCTMTSLSIPAARDRALQVSCTEANRREVLIDPYRGTLLGEREWDHTFFGIIFGLHWELLLGDNGRLAIEWATSWCVLLMISGVALWWPRGKRRGGGVWWPRRGLRERQKLRDLHAVFGAYAVPVVFALAATGLFWTLLAGERRWHPLTEDAAHDRWDAPPRSKAPFAGAARAGLDAAVRGAGIDRERDRRDIYLALPVEPDASYLVFPYDGSYESPSIGAAIWVDAYSGAKLDEVNWSHRSALGKLDSAAYAIHVGALLGLPGRILACIAALILAGLGLTGPWMWWRRRPRGRGLGAPPRARRAPWLLLALVAGLGWVLPTVGWTLLAVIAVEALIWLWRRRAGAARAQYR